jgi:hypothetical protein
MQFKRIMRFSWMIPRIILFALNTAFGATVVASGGCVGLQPPIQNSGAVTTTDGIQVAVLGQRCVKTVETDKPGNDLVEVAVQIEVRNKTPEALSVHRDGFRIIGADGRSIPTSTWSANEPMSLAPREVQTYQLRFMSRGGLRCSKEMTLEAPSAIMRGTDIAKIGTIKFVPRQRLAGY